MIKIENLVKTFKLDSNNFLQELYGYDIYSNVFNLISQIADQHVYTDYDDIVKFISENMNEVNTTINLVGWDKIGGDLINAAKKAQYFKYKNEMIDCIEEGLKHFAVSYYKSKYGQDVEFIPFDLWEDVEIIIDGIPEYLHEVSDVIDNYNMAITWK